MKTKLQSLIIGLALLAGVHPALAQNPVITSFSPNGVLVCSNLIAGSVATVAGADELGRAVGIGRERRGNHDGHCAHFFRNDVLPGAG